MFFALSCSSGVSLSEMWLILFPALPAWMVSSARAHLKLFLVVSTGWHYDHEEFSLCYTGRSYKVSWSWEAERWIRGNSILLLHCPLWLQFDMLPFISRPGPLCVGAAALCAKQLPGPSTGSCFWRLRETCLISPASRSVIRSSVQVKITCSDLQMWFCVSFISTKDLHFMGSLSTQGLGVRKSRWAECFEFLLMNWNTWTNQGRGEAMPGPESPWTM